MSGIGTDLLEDCSMHVDLKYNIDVSIDIDYNQLKRNLYATIESGQF